MACGSNSVPNKWEDISQVGIVSSHAYTIIGVFPIKTKDGRKIRLIKLRNPWGQMEWNGEWSDNSTSWTPELRT